MKALVRVLLLVAMVGCACLFPRHSRRVVASGGTGYPQLASLFSFSSAAQVPDYTHYALVVASAAAANGSPAPLSTLKSQSPSTRVLLYQASSFVTISDFGGMIIYPGWWLTLAGTTLRASIDASTTSIPVANAGIISAYLASNPDVLVDGESMHVTAVSTSTNTLTVQRGYRSTVASHNSGARLAAHATPGPYSGWMLNVTSYCPTNPSTGQTWDQYLTQWVAGKLGAAPWDGVFLDVTNADISYMTNGQIDADNDNVADGGNGTTGTAWHDGEAQLASSIHAAAPGALVTSNNGNYSPATSGIEFEHFPPPNMTWPYALAQYLQVAGSGTNGTSVVNPDTNNTGTQNLQTMRQGLATALMGNGYYNYDYGSQAHGQTWWYDEYDNGAGSSLAGAVGASSTSLTLAGGTGSRFVAGNVVFVPNTSGSTLDDEQMLVTAVSGDTLTVQRGYNGTAAQAHAATTKVMTQAQMDAGRGWLGQPTGPAAQQSLAAPDEISNGGFENSGSSWLSPWGFQVTSPAAASISRDTSTAGAGGASARVDVTTPYPASTWNVLLLQGNQQVVAGQPYTLTFQAKASVARSIDLIIRLGSAPYTVHSNPRYDLTTSWQTYSLTTTAPATETDQVMFALARSGGSVWIDDVHFQQGDPNVWQRTFTNGMVLLNDSTSARTVAVGAGYRHILGAQNPSLNNGAAVTSVTIPPSDAVLLVGTGSASTPTTTPVPPTATATNTPIAPTATPTATGGADQIVNGGFETGSFSPWLTLVVAPAAATFSLDTTTHAVESASSNINVGALNALKGTWSVQLYQNGPRVVAGHTYTLTFQARAAKARSMEAVLRQTTSPYTTRLDSRVNLGTGWQSYSIQFTAPATNAETVLFAFAQSTGSVWLDDVHFR